MGVSVDAVTTFGPPPRHDVYAPELGGHAAYTPGQSAAHPFAVMDTLGVDRAALFRRRLPDVALVTGITLPAALMGSSLGSAASAGIGSPRASSSPAGTSCSASPAPFLVILIFLSLPGSSTRPSLWVFGVRFVAILWPCHAATSCGSGP